MRFLREVVEKKGVHLQLWLEDERGEGFGRGRVQLLRLIEERGSLSKAELWRKGSISSRQAAEELGMSYRGAWGKLKKAERIAGVALVEASGTKRDGYSLTPEGRELVERFQQWYADVERYAEERARELFALDQEG